MYVLRLQEPQNVGQLRTLDDVSNYSRQRMHGPSGEGGVGLMDQERGGLLACA